MGMTKLRLAKSVEGRREDFAAGVRGFNAMLNSVVDLYRFAFMWISRC
jgi:hypothetical protein